MTGRSILIVEDESRIAHWPKVRFERAGFGADVAHDGRPFVLSRAQFAVLAAFMRHPHQVLTREQLISLAFGDRFDAYDRAVDSHIMRLRKRRIARGADPALLPVSADELGQMSDAFNRMAQALHTQRALRRRLINDLPTS